MAETDRYKNSDYRFEQVNGKFGLKHIPTEKYVDLRNSAYSWRYGTTWTKHCFGGAWAVIRAFNFVCPIMKPLKIEKIY